jgi:predicted phage tail protein
VTESEEKKEITVKAPAKSVVAPEKKAEKAAEKELEEERYTVLQVPNKVGKYLGLFSVIVGAAFLVLLTYVGVINQSSWLLLSANSSLPILGLWFVVGLASVIVGFLLMGSE